LFRLLLLFALGAGSLLAADAYTKSIEAWRAARVARLAKPDGWLTLIGLHWLQPGDNSVGAAAGNTLRLAAGPANFGVVRLAADGSVSFTPAAEANATFDGSPARVQPVELHYRDVEKPTVVRSGSVGFYVIQRGEKLGLRVKDSESPRRKNFAGLDYFPLDPAWRIEAKWVPFEQPREVRITNMLGQTESASVPGKAVFARAGRTFELLPIDEGPDEPLFFVIADETSGRETYDACRFVYAERPQDGVVVLDFNRAQNPPCAFTPFATCPLPPKGNRLPFSVRAGEKDYRGEHP